MHHKLLAKFGYIVRKDSITKEEEKTLLADLTVKTTVLPAYKEFQKPKIYRIYFHTKSVYYLPRYYGEALFGPPDFEALNAGAPMSAGLKCLYDPLPHQKTALSKAQKMFDPKSELGGGGVLSLPCGYGKTYCATKIATDYLKCAALVIVPTENLMDQWVEAIESFVPGIKVGYIQRDRIKVEGMDIVVAMLHSLCLKDYDAKLFDRFGITIYDECHHIASEGFCKSMMKIRTKFTLGLSATPNRRDGLSHVFYKFLGPLFHKERRSGSNVVYIKQITIDSNSENYTVLRMPNGTINTMGITTEIAKLVERNVLIIFLIKQMIAQGRKILIISSRKSHLHTLKEMLDAEGIRHPSTGKYITYGFYYGKKGMTRQAHRALLKESAKCDVVLGIDKIANEGLDIPDLNSLIFATPPGIEIEQPVGRILRKFHINLNPMVVDLVDNTGNYVKHSKERNKWYLEEGYVIQDHRLELLGDACWTEDVTAFIHTKNPPPQKTKTIKQVEEENPPEEEPDFAECLLDSVKPKTKVTIKHKMAPSVSQGSTGHNPLTDSCLLHDNPALDHKTKPKGSKGSKGPNFDDLMLY